MFSSLFEVPRQRRTGLSLFMKFRCMSLFVLRLLDEERGGRDGNEFARINIRTCV